MASDVIEIKSKVYGDSQVTINDEWENYSKITLADHALIFEWSYSGDKLKNPDDEMIGTDLVLSEGKIIANQNMFSSIKFMKHDHDNLWVIEICFNGTDRDPYMEFKNRVKAMSAFNQIEEWLRPVLTIKQ